MASVRSRSRRWSPNSPPVSNAGPTRGRLTVLAGPTAVGKGTVTAWLREHHPEVWISVSATTRKQRPGASPYSSWMRFSFGPSEANVRTGLARLAALISRC